MSLKKTLIGTKIIMGTLGMAFVANVLVNGFKEAQYDPIYNHPKLVSWEKEIRNLDSNLIAYKEELMAESRTEWENATEEEKSTRKIKRYVLCMSPEREIQYQTFRLQVEQKQDSLYALIRKEIETNPEIKEMQEKQDMYYRRAVWPVSMFWEE